eukprot:GHVS01100910.1.p1 GENE.GHVS01100910.1~~GHVS01100910.1.p1  ORF type:complete len:273 (+),score=37.78 GHVS01100910.1:416-1234(+)
MSDTTGREGGGGGGGNKQQMSNKANVGTKDGPSRLSEEFARGYLYGRVIRLVSRAASSQHDHPGTAIENNNDGYIVKVSRLPDGTSPTGNVNTTLKLRQSSFANWKVGPFVDDIVKVKFLRNDDQLFREQKIIPSTSRPTDWRGRQRMVHQSMNLTHELNLVTKIACEKNLPIFPSFSTPTWLPYICCEIQLLLLGKYIRLLLLLSHYLLLLFSDIPLLLLLFVVVVTTPTTLYTIYVRTAVIKLVLMVLVMWRCRPFDTYGSSRVVEREKY